MENINVKDLWISVKTKKPKKGDLLIVFGTLCKGTPYECTGKFTAFWNGGSWTDLAGDDFIDIDGSVEYWFDFDQVPDPDFSNDLFLIDLYPMTYTI